jgi:hypothetical protein
MKKSVMRWFETNYLNIHAILMTLKTMLVETDLAENVVNR